MHGPLPEVAQWPLRRRGHVLDELHDGALPLHLERIGAELPEVVPLRDLPEVGTAISA
jgi:hypothetical protein